MEATHKSFNAVKLMILVFVLLSAFFFIAKDILTAAGVDRWVVLTGNLILFLIGFFTLRRGLSAIKDPNPHVFVRVFYAGFIIRLFACAIAAFIYIYTNKGAISKPSLFVCLGIYMLYSVIEVSSLKKALRENKNA
ncbi:MAG: hypothetical protein QM640_07430 [Niabella sp.]